MKSKEGLKEFGRSLLWPLIELCIRFKVPPILLSLSSLPLSLGAGYLFYKGQFRLAALLLFLMGIADTIDGPVARAQGRASGSGAFLDSSLDRIADFFILLGLFLYYSPGSSAILLLLLLFTFFMVSYLRARAEGLGVECRIGVFERPMRVFILVIGALILNPNSFPVVLWILLFGTIFTIGQRLYWVLKQLRS